MLWRRARRQKSHIQDSLCDRPCAEYAARSPWLTCPDIMRQGCDSCKWATDAQREQDCLQVHDWEDRGPRGLTAPLCLCGCKVLGDGLPLPSRDSFQQTARVLVSSQFKKWPEKITSHGRWEVGTGPLGVHFWTENLEGGGAVRGSGSLTTALEGKMALHQALYCSSRLLGPRPQTLPQEHGSAGKKASSSSELLCYFWILHHFWSLWPHWEVLLQ